MNIPVHEGSKFTWTGSTGAVEASDLPNMYEARVWPDACDVGFLIRSHRTGELRLFVGAGQVVEHGELVCRQYRSYPDGKVEVKVFND